jgi:hypothetical protein
LQNPSLINGDSLQNLRRKTSRTFWKKKTEYLNGKIKALEINNENMLYGCETWSLTLREQRRLRVFENRVLRTIFGPKREEDRSWRKLHNDELHSLYSSPNIVRVIKSRRMRWAGHVTRIGEGKCVNRVLVGRPDGKKSLGTPRRKWEDNIVPVAGFCEHGDEPSGSIKTAGYFLIS